MFTIEDYTDTFEFRIFGEDYLKHRMFLVKNTFVHVKTFVREGWVNRETGKKSDPRLQFNSFQLLHDVMEKSVRKLSIQLNIKDLESKKIQNLKDLISMHPGSHLLNFVVYDNREKIKLEMPSRNQKIKVSQELLSELEEQQIYYRLNA